MRSSTPIIRRAAYDTEPMPYLVVGDREKYVVSTKDKVIGRELFLHGEFDFQKLVTALKIIRREGQQMPTHLIDVGANIGSITIPALVRGLMTSATAIEPHPENLKLLRANLALNDVSDLVTVIPHGVGAESNQRLYLQESQSNSGNHSISGSGLEIASSKLDDIEPHRQDALLWMDIEGYEGHALIGAHQIIEAGTPIACEFNPEFLHASAGMEFFMHSLSGRHIYDLRYGVAAERISLDDLALAYAGYPKFTDILAIKPSALAA